MNHQLIVVPLALVVGYFIWRMFLNHQPTITPAEADAAIKAGTAVLVDVREPAEWQAGVAAPATLLPLSDLRATRKHWGPFLAGHREKRILLYCHSGARSGMAAATLKAEGFDTANLGGFSNWTDSGLPARRP